ncbi:MAG TPA: hypothetical protein VLH86_03315 [Patescibacteria group bacterium]|nr:hypothetical protein [Patescibacteria group bacterium]
MPKFENVPDPHTELEAAWEAHQENVFSVAAHQTYTAEDLEVNPAASTLGREVAMLAPDGSFVKVRAYETVFEQVSVPVALGAIATPEVVLRETGVATTFEDNSSEDTVKYEIDVWDMTARPPVRVTHSLPTITRRWERGDVVGEVFEPEITDESQAATEVPCPEPGVLETMQTSLQTYADALCALMYERGLTVPETL